MIRGTMTTLSGLFILLSAVSIPFTSGTEDVDPFPCIQEGFFPIAGSCRKYYECYTLEGSLNSNPRECSPDTIFDAEFSVCRPLSRTNPSTCAVDSNEEITTLIPNVETLTNDRTLILPNNVPSEDANNTTQDTLITSNNVPSRDANVTTQEPTGQQAHDFTLDPKNGNATLDDPLEDFGDPNSSLSNGAIIATENDLNQTDDLNTELNNGTSIIETTTTTQAPVILTLCEHMNFVTTYATLAIGTPFYRQSLPYEEKFNKLAQMYNIILENVKNNSLVWKNGDSIFAGIKKTTQLASQYEREFNRKYEIYKQQIPKQTSDERIISKLQEDIRNLHEDIKSSEDVLSITNVPQVKDFLENNIKSKKQEIARKKEEIASSSTAALHLIEMLNFLQYVKADASEVENLATHLQIRIRTLSRQYSSDISTLQNILNQANESIHSLTFEANIFETHFADNTGRQQAIELQKVNLNDETIILNAENQANGKDIKKLQDKAERKKEIFQKKVIKTCRKGLINFMLKNITRPTQLEKEKACNELLEAKNVRLDIRNETDQIDKLLKENERNRNRITDILEEIDNANRELTQLHHKSRLREIRTEIGNLQSLQKDLLALSSSANDAVDSLSVIYEIVQEVNKSFEAFSKQFNIFISQVHSAETDEDRLQVKADIEEEVSELFPKTHQLELPILEMCT